MRELAHAYTCVWSEKVELIVQRVSNDEAHWLSISFEVLLGQSLQPHWAAEQDPT